MISPVNEIALAAPSEQKLSDSPRQIATSVDKFSEHLRTRKTSKAEQDRSSRNTRTSEAYAERGSTKSTRPATKSNTDSAELSKSDSQPSQNEEKSKRRDEETDRSQIDASAPSASCPAALEKIPTPFDDVKSPLGQDATSTLNDVDAATSNALAQATSVASELATGSQATTSVASISLVVAGADATKNPGNLERAIKNDPAESAITTPIQELPAGSLEIAKQAAIGSESGALSKAIESTKVSVTATEASNVSADPSVAPAVLTESTPAALEAGAAAPPPEPKPPKSSTIASFAHYLFGESRSPTSASQLAGLGIVPTSPVETSISGTSPEIDLTKSEDGPSYGGDKAQHSDSNPMLSPVDAAQAAATTMPSTLRRHFEVHSSSAQASSVNPPLTDPQQTRLLQRVAKAFRAAEERGGEVQIRLSPPELGSMKLELSLTSGVLTAKLEVETQRAQTILLDSLPALRDRLAEQGIRVEKFDVNLQQRDSGGQQPQQQQSQGERLPRSSSVANRSTADITSKETQSPARATADPTRLNVFV